MMAEGATVKNEERSMTVCISSICNGASRFPRDLWRARQCFHSCGASESRLSRETNDDDDDNKKNMKSEERKYSRKPGQVSLQYNFHELQDSM